MVHFFKFASNSKTTEMGSNTSAEKSISTPIGRQCNCKTNKTKKRKRNKEIHQYCCSIAGCLNSMGSLIKFPSEQNGDQYFSNIHREVLNQNLLSKFDSNVNWKYVIDIISSYLDPASKFQEYMAYFHADAEKASSPQQFCSKWYNGLKNNQSDRLELEVIVHGAGAIGKSCLVTRYVTGDFSGMYVENIKDAYQKPI